MYNYPNLTGIGSAGLNELAQSMKKYFTWNIVSICIGIFIALFTQLIMTFIMRFIYYGDIFSGIVLMVVFLLVSIGISITVYVYQYRYIMSLKRASEEVYHPELVKSAKDQLMAFKLQIGTAATAILLFIIGGLFFADLILMSYYDDINVTLLMLTVLVSLLMLGVSIAAIVKRIMGFVAFDKWGQQLYYAYSQDNLIRDLKEGLEYMKWGIIASLFVGSIGTIFYLVGFNKAFKSFEVLSQRPVGSPQSYQPPHPYPNHQPQYRSSAAPQPPSASDAFSGATIRPIPSPSVTPAPATTMKPHFCPDCGGTINDPNAKFCNICGRRL